MRAAVTEGGQITVGEVPDPEPGPGELVLKVLACGVCGSDVKTAAWMPDGTIMGHEFVGEVVAVGGEAGETWKTGEIAVSMPAVGCGACPGCRAGDVARCDTSDLIGLGGRAGAFAEYIAVGARQTWRFAGEDPLHGALVEPLAVALHLTARARLRSGDRLLVIGAGPVGLTVTTWARRLGVAEIVVSDPAAPRREAASAFGATRTVDPTTGEIAGPYDVVIECVGATGMVAQVIDLLRPRGRGVIGGVCLGNDAFMPVTAVTKDIDLMFASYYTTAEFAATARLLGSGEIHAGDLITARRGLDDLARTIGELASPDEQRKVLIVP